MSWNMSKKSTGAFGGWRLVTALGLAGLVLAATQGAAIASQDNDDQNDARKGIVGAWAVQVQLRNCETTVPLGPPFNSLVSFHADGTLSENPGSLAFAPGQRSAGHGSWTRQGRRTYVQNMVALLLFDTPPTYPVPPGGFLAGWQTITHTVTLVDANHYTSSGTNAFYKANGEVYRTGCSTAVAERFE